MRIGIYASSIAVRPGYEQIVSGHVQVPLHTAKLLSESGHDVELITTAFDSSMCLPAMTPVGVPVRQLHNVQLPVSAGGTRSNVEGMRHFKRTLLSVFGLVRLAKKQKYDVLHLFGASGTAALAGLVSLAGIHCPVVVTLNTGREPKPSSFVWTWLWKRIDQILTTTDYFQSALASRGIASDVIRHGVIREFENTHCGSAVRNRVLFWREASPLNGGDIGAEVFRRLAPKYPHINFDFAVRPHRLQPELVEKLVDTMPNVNLFTTPYPSGVTLEGLLAEAICVLQPFRAFTIQPQLSILESMHAGVAVITTDIESASELIDSGEDGLLVPPENPDAAASAVESLILDRQLADSLAAVARKAAPDKWNWNGYTEKLLNHYKKLVSGSW